MNAENVKQVRDLIASLPPEQFSMLSYVGIRDEVGDVCDWDPVGATNAEALDGSCGTCGCIAGWALALLEPDAPQSRQPIVDAGVALDISYEAARHLFEPNNFASEFDGGLSRVTQAQAVRVLDRLIETGEVDWTAAREDASLTEGAR